MRLAGVGAGDKGVQTFNPMGKTVTDQKFQCTVSRWWLCPFSQNIKDFIGPHGAVFFQKNLQNPPARRRQLQPCRAAMVISGGDRFTDAMLVVMSFKSDHRGLICYTITHIKSRFPTGCSMPIRLAAFLMVLATQALAEAPRVVADIAPVHSLVAWVMQGVAEPDLLLPPGASPHSYSMRPSEAAALESADIVFWIGPNLTPWLEGPIGNLADDALVVSLLRQDGTVVLSLEDHEPGHSDTDHSELDDIDPHAWLDPVNGRHWLAAIAKTLSAADPGNASAYQDNAAKAELAIRQLQTEMVRDLSSLKSKTYAVDHDAYGYLEQRFGLSHLLAVTTTHAATPGPARIGSLRAMAKEAVIDCVLTSTKEAAGLVETVFEGQSPNIIQIDPIGANLKPGPLLYMDLMYRLSRDLWTC